MAIRDKSNTPDRNPDPITNEPGAHPVGVGVGTAVGGAAAGALGGSVAGPVGTVAGAVIGGIAGGLAGKGVGELIDPTEEDNYWRENYRTRPYVTEGELYDDYQSAYMYGVDARRQYGGRPYDEVEGDLRGGWDSARGSSRLPWDRASPAARDAYERLGQNRSTSVDVG